MASSSSPGFKYRTKIHDSLPAFFTGVGSRNVNLNSVSTLLCKSCKKTLDDDDDPEQLCSNCIIKQKSTKTQNNSYLNSDSSSKGSIQNDTKRHHVASQQRSSEKFPSSSSNSAEKGISFNNTYIGKDKNSKQQREHLRSQTQPYARKSTINNIDSNFPRESRNRRHTIGNQVEQFHAARNTCRESRQEYSNVSQWNETDGLSGQIYEMFLANKQTDEIYARKMDLRDRLHQMLCQEFPCCALYVVGSSMTWLGAQTSDIDMCLMLTDAEVDQKTEAISILQSVRRLLRKKRFCGFIQLIPAKVPLLKFTDFQSQIEVDLNINNADGIRNTQLLSSYARMDSRLPPLVVLVKLWARHQGINDAKSASLSSYTIVLMVIHFLQYRCDPPVLPSLQLLQPDKYHPESDIRSLNLEEDLPHFLSDNLSDCGELFLGFLKYYAHEFDYAKSAISVRLGTVLPRETVVNHPNPKNKKTDWKLLCVEEPFNRTNVARSIYKEDVFEYIKFVFDLNWKQLSRHGDLNAVFA